MYRIFHRKKEQKINDEQYIFHCFANLLCFPPKIDSHKYIQDITRYCHVLFMSENAHRNGVLYIITHKYILKLIVI